jgi:hypothetical protein
LHIWQSVEVYFWKIKATIYNKCQNSMGIWNFFSYLLSYTLFNDLINVKSLQLLVSWEPCITSRNAQVSTQPHFL